eukprot:s1246_g34.t1
MQPTATAAVMWLVPFSDGCSCDGQCKLSVARHGTGEAYGLCGRPIMNSVGLQIQQDQWIGSAGYQWICWGIAGFEDILG